MADDKPDKPATKARRPQEGDLEPVLELIWEGKSLRAACTELGLHTPATSDWLHADVSPNGRREQYMRAREGRAQALMEEGLTVTKAAALRQKVLGQPVDPSGARAYLDAIKWATGRMAPKTFGDKQVHEHTGAGGGPIQTLDLSNASADDLARLDAILAGVALPHHDGGAGDALPDADTGGDHPPPGS